MNVKHRWYLRTYSNVKERVNAINFARELESVYFDKSCQNGAFNIWKTPMLIDYRILDSNIESKSLNNTYLNIIELLFYLF